MVKFHNAALVVFIAALAACAGGGAATSADEEVVSAPEPIAFSLGGYNETVFVADESGVASIVRIGATSTRAKVSGLPLGRIVAGASRNGRFRLLTADGRLRQVDASSAQVTQTADTDVRNAADFAMSMEGSVAYVTAESKMYQVDSTTGRTTAILDLATAARAPNELVTLRSVLVLGDRILVQVARDIRENPTRGAVAIVNRRTFALERLVELTVNNGTTSPLEAANPGGPFILDEPTNSIYLTALGGRNEATTGATLRFDATTLELAPWALQYPAYHGPIVLGPGDASPRYAFTGEHTRTPVASTHLKAWTVDSLGKFQDDPTGGTLLNAFEELLSFPVNGDKTLFAWPISCPAGFCLGGVGISFIDTRTRTIFPRLGESDLGLAPYFVIFGVP